VTPEEERRNAEMWRETVANIRTVADGQYRRLAAGEPDPTELTKLSTGVALISNLQPVGFSIAQDMLGKEWRERFRAEGARPELTPTVRAAARARVPLDGTDAQAFEGALDMTERELRELRRLHGLVTGEPAALGHELKQAEADRDRYRSRLGYAQAVIADHETALRDVQGFFEELIAVEGPDAVDAGTIEKVRDALDPDGVGVRAEALQGSLSSQAAGLQAEVARLRGELGVAQSELVRVRTDRRDAIELLGQVSEALHAHQQGEGRHALDAELEDRVHGLYSDLEGQ
jgi:hypothetical protein